MNKMMARLMLVVMLCAMGTSIVSSVGCSMASAKKSKASAKKKKKKTEKKKKAEKPKVRKKREVELNVIQVDMIKDYVTLLSSSKKKKRIDGCQGLGNMSYNAQVALGDLEKIAKNDESSDVRKAASRAIKDIKKNMYHWVEVEE